MKFALDLDRGGLERLLYVLKVMSDKEKEGARGQRLQRQQQNNPAAAPAPPENDFHAGHSDSEDEMSPPDATFCGYATELYKLLKQIQRHHIQAMLQLSKGHLELCMLLDRYEDYNIQRWSAASARSSEYHQQSLQSAWLLL